MAAEESTLVVSWKEAAEIQLGTPREALVIPSSVGEDVAGLASLNSISFLSDLRNPELTRSLSPNADAGLLEVATGQIPLEQVLLLDRSTGLSILPSAAMRDHDTITELMFSQQMSDLIDRLRHHFELIIIDSPPLVPLVDGRALAELSDRIILALAWDQTPEDVVAHTIDLLSPVYDRLLGTVLTRVDLRRLRFYDYYRSSAYLKPYGVSGLDSGAAA